MGRPRKKRKISKSSSPRARLPKRAKKGARRKKPEPAPLPSGPPRKSKASTTSARRGPKDPNRQRLQKVLAAAGCGSRRECETYITEGRVEVDGEVVSELGATVDPTKQQIRFDGDVVSRFKPIYYLVNKPTGILSTNKDPSGRMRVIDLVPEGTKLFTVGRLDKGSEGLMLVTNDGDLANRLAHPRYGVEKVYHVVVAGSPKSDALKTLRRGIHLAEGAVRVSRLSVKKKLKNSTQLEMVLTEGRNREIRRMAAHIGHKVVSLKRIGIGPLRLGTMPAGAYRPLTGPELKRLRDLAAGKSRKKSAKKSLARKSTKGTKKTSSGKPGKTKAKATMAKGKSTKGKSTKGKSTKGKATKGSGAKGRRSGGENSARGTRGAARKKTNYKKKKTRR